MTEARPRPRLRHKAKTNCVEAEAQRATGARPKSRPIMRPTVTEAKVIVMMPRPVATRMRERPRLRSRTRLYL